ncbi:MAG: DNA alkylation repair protein [Clostridia bacterium]|nr:DNA alkylation repair protein [Clostridia bacterium]
MNEALKKELAALSSEKHAEFSKKLIPTSALIMGVKTPELKRLAKKISRGDYKAFLSAPCYNTYEETALRALVISFAKLDLSERLALIEDFVPHIDNWAVCDLFCSALRPVIKKNRGEFFALIQKYLYSDKEFYIRFGLVVILVGFVCEEYAPLAFEIFDTVDKSAFYAMMGAAWTLAEFYIKLPELTLPYLLNNRLDDRTYNKAISKMLESYRVSDEDKKMLRRMKRKSS